VSAGDFDFIFGPAGETGWAEHERDQRKAWLRLTPRQRLDWLWEARLFALRAEEARRLRQSARSEK
jgi:hypothetical protein